MTDDVFTEDQGGNKPSNVFELLVGDGKKFSTPEELAIGKQKADEHIKTIESENTELKQQLETLKGKESNEATIKELVTILKDAETNKGSPEGKTISPEELTKLVRSVVSEDRSAETKAANRRKGNELVLSKVDGNAEAAKVLVAERAKALGMTPSGLAELSENSPTAFARLMGVEQTPSSGRATQLPGQRTDVTKEGDKPMEIDGYHTAAYFEAKRKEMGNVKFLANKSIQTEFAKSIAALGERFN